MLYRAWREHHGKDTDDPVLVWQADTRTMNPAVPQGVIDRAYEEDPASAAAEYGAQFRTDVEGYVTREVVEACVVVGRHELPPMKDTMYVGFTDPSGGSQDAYTLAIAHRDEAKPSMVLDAVRETRPPFSPEQVTAEFAEFLKRYRITTVEGDRYAGEWPREQFRKHGIEYRPCGTAKSDLYKSMLPELNSGKVELLDHPRLLAQLVGLERKTARGGRDSIDHAPGQHDDLINSVAGALASLGDMAPIEFFTAIIPFDTEPDVDLLEIGWRSL